MSTTRQAFDPAKNAADGARLRRQARKAAALGQHARARTLNERAELCERLGELHAAEEARGPRPEPSGAPAGEGRAMMARGLLYRFEEAVADCIGARRGKRPETPLSDSQIDDLASCLEAEGRGEEAETARALLRHRAAFNRRMASKDPEAFGFVKPIMAGHQGESALDSAS